MAASRLELPLFRRYHDAARTGKAKAALAKLGLTPVPSSSDGDLLLLDCQLAEGDAAAAGLLEQAAAALNMAIGKNFDANYFVGVDLGGSTAFEAALAAVHATVRQRSAGSAEAEAVASACLPSTRWTLCLGVLRIYSPQQLAEIQAVLSDELADGAAAKLRVGFEGLRCFGASKLAAAVAADDAVALSELAARLAARLPRWSGGYKPPGPHVTVVKFTWPLGDKKAKAASSQAAGRASLHKLDWSGAEGCSSGLPTPFAVLAENVGPLSLSLYEMHPGGGAGMRDDPYAVAWSAAAAPEPEPEPEPASEPELEPEQSSSDEDLDFLDVLEEATAVADTGPPAM